MSHRTSIELYRDLLRLVAHIAPGTTSPKSIALRTMIRSEFNKSKHLSPTTDEVQIETMKANAVRALSNYMLYKSGMQDKSSSNKGSGTLGKAMDDFHVRNVEGLNRQSSNSNDNDDKKGGAV